MKNFNIIFTLLMLVSCSSYVNNVHKQIDQEERSRSSTYRSQQNPAARQNRGFIKNPRTLNGVNSNNFQNMPPQTRRNYTEGGRRRFQANDLNDNEPDGSLWSGKSPDSFLFVTNNIKSEGDIVIIEVMSDLKLKISEELKSTFPPRKSKTTAKKEEPTVAAGSGKGDGENLEENKIYDKISTSVIEKVNKDYLFLRGRKEVIYEKVKRFIEIQGVVASRDIKDNDSVSSLKLLEPKITVLRY